MPAVPTPDHPTASLDVRCHEARLLVDVLWDLEERMRRDRLDASDPRLVEVIELRSRAEKAHRSLSRVG